MWLTSFINVHYTELFVLKNHSKHSLMVWGHKELFLEVIADVFDDNLLTVFGEFVFDFLEEGREEKVS